MTHFNIRNPSEGAQLRDKYRISHEYRTRAARADKSAQPKFRLERTRRLYQNHYLYMLNHLPRDIKDNTKPKISEKKKLIRDFIKGLPKERVMQLCQLGTFS